MTGVSSALPHRRFLASVDRAPPPAATTLGQVMLTGGRAGTIVATSHSPAARRSVAADRHRLSPGYAGSAPPRTKPPAR
jgi:hypothetical protein